MGIKLKPHLIPRFNIDYDLQDFLYSISNLNKKPDIDVALAMFPHCELYWTNSGRASLYTILRSLLLPDKSHIGVPLYTCPSDFDAIIEAGHVPVYLDIDPDNLTLSPDDLRKKIDSLDAVVVVHTFGRPANMDEILSICSKIPVIEDCAHSFLSRYGNDLTGTIGIAGFYSFRSGKYISAGEGGLIVTKDPVLGERINNEIESYHVYSNKDEVLHSFVTYIRSFMYHAPWFGLFSLPIGKRLEKKVDLMNKYSFNICKIRKTDLHVLLKKMQTFKDKVAINRSNSFYIMNNLKIQGLHFPPESEKSWCNYFLFPIIFDNIALRDTVSERLFDKNIDNAKMFSETPQIAKELYNYSGDCPATEFIAERILIVPTYYTIKKTKLDTILREIEYAISEKSIEKDI